MIARCCRRRCFLTAGHCTFYFTESGAEELVVSFDPQVTADSEFITASTWYTHPDYVDAGWPDTPSSRRRRADRPARPPPGSSAAA